MAERIQVTGLNDPIKGERTSRKFVAFTKAPEQEQRETVKAKGTQLSYILAEKALNLARSPEKNHLLTGALTAAAIAYDKRWAKQDMNEVTVSIPQSMIGSVRLALQVQGLPKEATNGVLQAAPTDSVRISHEPSPDVDGEPVS